MSDEALQLWLRGTCHPSMQNARIHSQIHHPTLDEQSNCTTRQVTIAQDFNMTRLYLLFRVSAVCKSSSACLSSEE